MRVDLTDRQPLYVSRATHEKLMKIVTVIGGRKATVSSYVENILLRHFDQFQDEINELYESKFEKPFCPRENSCMYHWTAIENAAGITKHGILPMGNSKYVYITDDPEFIAKSGYLHWKVLAAKKDTIFVPIKIDAHALAAEYELSLIHI